MKKQSFDSKKSGGKKFDKKKWVRIVALVLAALMVGGMVFVTAISLN